jgi:two-component system, sensor histidine kinase ChiS
MTKRIKILVVDDDQMAQKLIHFLLADEYYQLIEAQNGAEAIRIIDKSSDFSLVLLDVMMPDISGLEVCRHIRKKFLPSALPVIMITANDDEDSLAEGFEAGTNDFIRKPIKRSELISRIRSHLQILNISTAYSRFIPKEILKALGHDSIVNVKLGDQIQGNMTIFFSDIRSFTQMSENLSPKESFEFLNRYLNYVTPPIQNNHGFVDKYIGDAVMALFPLKADDALKAAMDTL